jgi:hypothetical protein
MLNPMGISPTASLCVTPWVSHQDLDIPNSVLMPWLYAVLA